MYVNWKALTSFGIIFWSVLIFTDLLGDCSWKQHSSHLNDILQTTSMQPLKDGEQRIASTSVSWSQLIWNMFAFLCAIIFCSFLKSTSWIIWKIIKIYHFARHRKISNPIIENDSRSTTELSTDNKTKLIFKNQLYSPNLIQDHSVLLEEIEELKKEKHDLKEQLVLAQKENFESRQQVEEFKLESIMLQEKLTRATNTLKENLKYKDMSSANQEIAERKAHNLEIHLREVSRDRDNLRSKLSMLEKKYTILEEKIREYEKHDTESNLEQLPEKDVQPNEIVEASTTENEVDMSSFQKKIQELQRNLQGAKNSYFESNSKISVDLEDSSMEALQKEGKKADIDSIKQHLMNFNAYKVQMLRPKLKLSDLKSKLYAGHNDTTGSSSDECSAQRLISGRVEFQNFLKTLSSTSSINYHGVL